MRETQFELSVGDSLQVDDQILTVIDITGEEITFRIDRSDAFESENASCAGETENRFPPR